MSEFSRDSYLRALNKAKGLGFQVGPVPYSQEELPHKYLSLRHDIDFSIEYALDMAILERESGFRSTFYVMVSSPYYNPFCKTSIEQLSKIIELGHHVGLHWDARRTNIQDDTKPIAVLSKEIALLEAALGTRLQHISQHEPTSSPHMAIELEGVREAYQPVLDGTFDYISDSTMSWRNQSIFEKLETATQRLQFLAHPLWWMTRSASFEGKLSEFVSSVNSKTDDLIKDYKSYSSKVLLERKVLDDKFRNR